MTPEQRAIRERRDAAIAEADRKYRWALETASDEMREARQTYNREMVAAQELWRKEMAELDPHRAGGGG